MTNAIDTAKTTPYRKLRFQSIDELLSEIDRIVASDQAGKLKRSGNWTAGQIFNHLAGWINFGYEGFPTDARPPWFIRVLIRMKKKGYLRDGMPRGVKIPRVTNGTWVTDPLDTQEGAKRLRQALLRLKNREPVQHHSPAFGEMTDDERIQMTLRHAELHLGYLHP